MVLAIEIAQAAQPIIARDTTYDSDAPDEDAGEAGQIPLLGDDATQAVQANTPDLTSRNNGMPAAPDEDGPVWPDEATESAMRAEVVTRGETLNSKAAREAAEAAAEAAAEKRNLPPLDELIGKIPADVRDTLEDLFRVKFMKVARSPKKAFKT